MSSTANTILEGIKARRSIHQLFPESTIPDSRIEEIVQETILYTPSPFNVQGTRLVVLLKEEHHKFWDIAREVAIATEPAEVFEKLYKPRIEMFRAGYGTILFYEDPSAFQALEAKWPMLTDKFPQWSEQSNAMHQIILWTTLEAEGLGCNLQHYNPMIDAAVSKQWDIPVEWSLKAQLVFGKPAASPREKTFEPLEKRLFVYGK